jgi:hypothetical protein
MEDKERLRAEARYPSRTGCRSHLTYEGRSCRGAVGTSKRRDGSDRRQRRSSTATRCRAVAHRTKAMDVHVEPLVVCYMLCRVVCSRHEQSQTPPVTRKHVPNKTGDEVDILSASCFAAKYMPEHPDV